MRSLSNKYKKDYKIEEILAGTNSAQVKERARIAKFDERLSLLGMMLDRLISEMRENLEMADYLSELMKPLKRMKATAEAKKLEGSEFSMEDLLSLVFKQAESRKKLMDSMHRAGTLSSEDKKKYRSIMRFLEDGAKKLRMQDVATAEAGFTALKSLFDEEVAMMKKENAKIQERLHNVFAFSEEAFMDGNEMIVLVTELTVNAYSSRFIGLYGSADYQKHNEELMLHERQDDILQEIAELDL